MLRILTAACLHPQVFYLALLANFVGEREQTVVRTNIPDVVEVVIMHVKNLL